MTNLKIATFLLCVSYLFFKLQLRISLASTSIVSPNNHHQPLVGLPTLRHRLTSLLTDENSSYFLLSF